METVTICPKYHNNAEPKGQFPNVQLTFLGQINCSIKNLDFLSSFCD